MEKSLSFFRVFDVAFFAPGMVVLVATWKAGLYPEEQLSAKIETGAGLVGVLAVVALVYFLGLLCHGGQRALWCLLRGCSWLRDAGKGGPDSWFVVLERKTQDELATYFWYLRATCWNLAISVLAGAAILSCGKPCGIGCGAWSGVVIAVAALLALGLDYHRAMNKAIHSLSTKSQP